MFSKYILNPLINSIENFSNRNAFCINEQMFTYTQFAQYISKVRAAIQKADFKNTNIGLVVNDDIETYASIFAIWIEGYAYVPLHPQQPIERSLEIISQAEIELVIDSSVNTAFIGLTVIESTKLNFESLNLDIKHINDDNLAYILFTSGSTVNPKV